MTDTDADTATEPPAGARISPGLEALAVPIESLTYLPGNPRLGNVDAVARSLDRFGQRKPIVVNRANAVVEAGNHTLQAARQLGWAEIAAVFVDDDEATARAFALADNRTGDLGVYDDELLARMISEVRDFDESLLGDTGWGAEAVEALMAQVAGGPPPESPDDFPEFDHAIATDFRCPSCGFEWSGREK